MTSFCTCAGEPTQLLDMHDVAMTRRRCQLAKSAAPSHALARRSGHIDLPGREGLIWQASVASQARAAPAARKDNRSVSSDGNWLAQPLRPLTMSERPHHSPAVPPHRRRMRTGYPYELPGPPLPERQRLPDNRIPLFRASER